MASSITRFRNPVRAWGLGVLLGLSASTMLLPQDVYAKGKKSVAASEHSKKTSKKLASTKTTATNKKAKSSKTLTTSKQGKSAKLAKTGKNSKLASKQLASHTTKHKTTSRHPLAKAAPEPTHVWNNTEHGKQAYYVMPGSSAESAQKAAQIPAVEDQQPVVAETENLAVKPYQVGTASYYSSDFEGKRTASGERFSQNNLTCAHGSLPFGCRLRVTNLRNNKSVDVRVNDRGGFRRYGRVLDLTKAAARAIGMLGTGTAKVRVDVLE